MDPRLWHFTEKMPPFDEPTIADQATEIGQMTLRLEDAARRLTLARPSGGKNAGSPIWLARG